MEYAQHQLFRLPLNDLLQSIFERLSKSGPVDLAADWDELRRIEALAEKSSLTDRAGLLRLVEEPAVCLLGLTFHRLTIGAEAFCRQAEQHLHSNALRNLLYAFALVHARDPRGSLWPLMSDPSALARRLKDWKRDIGLTHEEIARCLAYIDTDDRVRTAESEKKDLPDYGETVTSLVREFGQTPEYWIWDCPGDEIEMLVSNAAKAAAEEARASSKATDPDRRDVRAHRDLMAAVKGLEEKIRKRDPEGAEP